MSKWQDPLKDLRRNATSTQAKALLQRCDNILERITYKPICSFTTSNLYRNKSDSSYKVGCNFPGPFLPDGSIKPGPSVAWAIAKVTDFNDKRETGRETNTTYKAKELFNGKTEFYVAYPLEKAEGPMGLPNFAGVPDKSWEPVIDPRLFALQTYPDEISSVAENIVNDQASTFTRSFPYTLNVNGEYIPLDFNEYCSSVADNFLHVAEQTPGFTLE